MNTSAVIQETRGFRIWPGAYALIAVAAAAFVFLFDPARHDVYPPCVFHSLTGCWCPGCGSTRAIHQLLHGRVRAAIDLNALLVVLLPVVAGAWLLERGERIRGRRYLSNPIFAWSLVVIVVSFWIMRNLPFPLFEKLAP